jgi:hypothetical protein
MRGHSSRAVWRGLSELSATKHVECYHAGDDNRRIIQGMVELKGCVAILGAGAGGPRSKNPTCQGDTLREINFRL